MKALLMILPECLLLLSPLASVHSVENPLPNLTGDWDTNHGVVYLDQEGDRISAEFDFKGKRDNRLTGVLKGTTLEVTFEQPSLAPPLNRGRAILTIRANGTRWEGPWYDAGGKQQGIWEGIKIGATPEQPDREFAPLLSSPVSYPDFTRKTADGKGEIHLADFVAGKPLVLVSTFAGWCKNCNWEAPVLAELYEKYHARGFDIIQVSEYTHPVDVAKFLERHHPPFPVVVGSTTTDDATREGTDHYRFRKLVGDKRKWGTPFNVFIVKGDLSKPLVVAGELMEDEVDAFIARKLPAP
ncbi:MAG: TlpA family protein disulfide reductase [Acidobacteria bacterium]|nr:TlpA family protein disulfide reductase [Acidobacteriota bacterium]